MSDAVRKWVESRRADGVRYRETEAVLRLVEAVSEYLETGRQADAERTAAALAALVGEKGSG